MDFCFPKKPTDLLSPNNSIILEKKESYNEKMDNLAKFFKGERKKINIWTYLFKELSKSIDQILRMCEIESKSSFCKGVEETLKNGLKSLENIEHKIKLETNSLNQNCAWDVGFLDKENPEDILRESGISGYQDIFDEEGLVEFKLLNELVLKGKMNFWDAIVLIIRERASIFGVMDKKQNKKDLYCNLRNSLDFNQSNSSIRAISTPLPITTLMNRINLKLKFVNIDEAEDFSKEERERKLENKLVLAEKRKNLLNKKKKEEITKLNLKVDEVLKKNNFLVQQKCDNIIKKEREYHLRKFNKLDEIKKKAEQNKMKPSEVSFLMLLEKYSDNLKLDNKLEQTRKTRLKIIKEIKDTYISNNTIAVKNVINKKEELESIRKKKVLQKLQKFEKANDRRFKLLEIKKNNAKKKIKKDFYEIFSGDILDANQNETSNLMELFNYKEKSDYLFNEFKILEKKLEKIEDPEFKSNSFHFEPDEQYSEFFDKQNKKRSIDKSLKGYTIKKKNKNKHKKKNETKISFLSHYYNFLTFNQITKKERKKEIRKKRNSVLEITKPQKIEELPELICREVGIKEKKMLQTNKFNFCKICDQIVENVEDHLNSKTHNKLLSVSTKKSNNDNIDNIMTLVGENKANQQKICALKRKCKKIKNNIQSKFLQEEELFLKNEHYNSQNKIRLQKLTLDFEKLVLEQNLNYENISGVIKEIHKMVDKHNEADLHILRTSRFINIFIEFIKKSHFCSKFDFPYFIKILNNHFGILSKLCLIKENRNYLFLTNQVIPLVELFSWSSGMIPNTPELSYFPELLNLLSFLLRNSLDEDKQFFKTALIEYIYYSGFMNKIQKKFTKENFIQMEDTPYKSMVILTSLKLIENLTAFFQETKKLVCLPSKSIPESILFLIKETEVAGTLHLLATILLSNGQFKRQIQELSPITLTYSFFIIRIFNNVARMDLNLIQNLLGGISFNSDQLYHVAIFLFDYCMVNFKKTNEIIKILTELILLIGYFALENDDNKALLSRGTEKHCVVYKLCKLPFEIYFKDSLLREILIPTLIAVIDGNKRNLNIFEKTVSVQVLIDYVDEKLKIFAGKSNEEIYQLLKQRISEEINSKEEFIDHSTVNENFYIIMTRYPIDKLENFKNFLKTKK
jgi:hypothetical protein